MSTSDTSQPHITLLHRSAAGAGASLVSAIVVNPLDVVKTRLQAQGAIDASARALHTANSASLLEKWNFAACGPSCVRVSNPALPSNACGPACEPPVQYRGTIHALRTIARTEGVTTLWRGTNVALMMAIPMVGIYLPLYDYLLEKAQTQGAVAGAVAPLLSGILARTVAVYCTAPFELIRTRIQAVSHIPRPVNSPSPTTPYGIGIAAAAASSTSASSSSCGKAMSSPQQQLLQHLPSIQNGSRASAVRGLWKGVGATLARDVPFSGMYWALVEPIREELLPPTGASTEMQVFTANVAAGGLSGGLSGALTTPLDVVKTRTQLQMGKSHPVWHTLRSILKDEGVAGLFRGWSARSAKAAPACAIVLSAYEMLKFFGTDGRPGS